MIYFFCAFSFRVSNHLFEFQQKTTTFIHFFPRKIHYLLFLTSIEFKVSLPNRCVPFSDRFSDQFFLILIKKDQRRDSRRSLFFFFSFFDQSHLLSLSLDSPFVFLDYLSLHEAVSFVGVSYVFFRCPYHPHCC